MTTLPRTRTRRPLANATSKCPAGPKRQRSRVKPSAPRLLLRPLPALPPPNQLLQPCCTAPPYPSPSLRTTPLWLTDAWRALLKSRGVKCVPIPAHSPSCRPHAKRLDKGTAAAGPIQCRSTTSQSNPYQIHGWIEALQVVRIAGHYHVIALFGSDDHGSINDIARASDSTKLPAGSTEFAVQRHNLYLARPKQASECDLAAAVPPRLTNYARWHSKAKSLRKDVLQQCDHSPISPIQGDKRSGIQCHPRRR